ncbi:MAG: hypothetical protein AMJ92_06755 [candidate division Zixibacteria bacterium SM23_81]|nr:MAG: hypothetical protein AMJ92_06755 [candidate division Zixibacteria bacterium SM23_81]
MAVFPIYEDFFRFLEVLEVGEDPWEVYEEMYFRPHKNFFGAYWRTFFPLMDVRTLQDRVRQVRRGHYAALEHLIGQSRPEDIVQENLSRCRAHLPRLPEPDVYLIVGFFSADGFVVNVNSRPAIGIGLERFKDFRLLDIILAHEYCHCARYLALGSCAETEPETLGQKLLSEGLSVYFSQRVYPQRRLFDHLLMSRRRLNWCQQNEQLLKTTAERELTSSRLVPVFFQRGKPGAGIPPRTGMYLAYRLVERALSEMREEEFEELLTTRDIMAIWPADSSGR